MAGRFADIWLTQAVPEALSYLVPAHLQSKIQVGQRVLVPLGHGKMVTGVVRRLVEEAPETHLRIKSIHSIQEEKPVVREYQWALFEWIKNYYVCRPGDILSAALPAGLKPASEQIYCRVLHAQPLEESLSDKEYILWEAFMIQEEINPKQAKAVLGPNQALPILKSLLDKGLIRLEMRVQQKYKPKTESFLRLSKGMEKEEALRQTMNELSKAPKQLEILMQFLRLSDAFGASPLPVRKSKLLETLPKGSSPLNELLKKGILEMEAIPTNRMPQFGAGSPTRQGLSAAQEKALSAIQEGFALNKPVVLQGVTGSGKTALYLKLIEETITQGKQVWYLIPEIALTTQLIERVAERFPGKVTVYHSQLSDAERVEVHQQFLKEAEEDQPSVVLGPRSSLFLPLARPGLILVDESHDPGYKQQDPAPRYHGRHVAIWLARHLKIPVLLGSATPSLESWHLAALGKYHLVRLLERFGEVKLPEIKVVDLTRIPKESEEKNFSPDLLEALGHCLHHRKQAILFHNRRGFSQYLKCLDCKEVPQCKHCDISLTFHKSNSEMRCHYCGYARPLPNQCPNCQSNRLVRFGLGTEKVEEKLQTHFPKARLERMDLDTTRRKHAFRDIIQRFAQGETDFLTGTQMVTKGLDFERVHLVGVLLADNLLYFPDFRAQERAFQLLVQVSGRAGRRNDRGLVLIQTYAPSHPVIRAVLAEDLEGFYARELNERAQYAYPPYTRLLYIDLKHKSHPHVLAASQQLAKGLKAYSGWQVLGPEPPGPARVRNLFQFRIILKIPIDADYISIRRFLKHHLDLIGKLKPAPFLHVDVDPN